MDTIKTKVVSSGKYLAANCPFCVDVGKTPDTKYHLYILKGRWVFCYRCSYKTSYNKFIQRYRIDTSGLKDEPVKRKSDDFDVDISKNVKGFNSSTYSLGALNYLKKRKITGDVAKRMNIKLGVERLFGRVVFLDTQNRYYVARSFLPNLEPKTLNPASAVRPLMYLENNCVDTLYLVEGCFDCVPFFKTNRPVAALLGKDISSEQMKQLKSIPGIRNIIVSLDSDAVEGAKNLAKRITDEMPLMNVRMLMYDDKNSKDPSDLDTKLFTKTAIHWIRLISEPAVGHHV